MDVDEDRAVTGQYGSASMSRLQMPSAARSSASPLCSMTAASSPNEATTWGASILRALTISPMACFRFTPSYSLTTCAIFVVEQSETTLFTRVCTAV